MAFAVEGAGCCNAQGVGRPAGLDEVASLGQRIIFAVPIDGSGFPGIGSNGIHLGLDPSIHFVVDALEHGALVGREVEGGVVVVGVAVLRIVSAETHVGIRC